MPKPLTAILATSSDAYPVDTAAQIADRKSRVLAQKSFKRTRRTESRRSNVVRTSAVLLDEGDPEKVADTLHERSGAEEVGSLLDIGWCTCKIDGDIDHGDGRTGGKRVGHERSCASNGNNEILATLCLCQRAWLEKGNVRDQRRGSFGSFEGIGIRTR